MCKVHKCNHLGSIHSSNKIALPLLWCKFRGSLSSKQKCQVILEGSNKEHLCKCKVIYIYIYISYHHIKVTYCTWSPSIRFVLNFFSYRNTFANFGPKRSHLQLFQVPNALDVLWWKISLTTVHGLTFLTCPLKKKSGNLLPFCCKVHSDHRQ